MSGEMTSAIRQEIEELLNSNVSAYRIAKESGVPQSTVTDLRNGKRPLDNITLLNAEKLAAYYQHFKEELEKMKEWNVEDVLVKEVALDGNLHRFQVYYQDTLTGTITPASLEEMEQIIQNLDKGGNPLAEGWGDGLGNNLSYPEVAE